jgi:hypothetical protein
VATNREDIELAFNVELETRKAMLSISNIDKQLRKTINQKLQIKAFDSKGIRAFGRELTRSKKALREVSFSMSPRTRSRFRKDFEGVGQSYRSLTKVVRKERSKVTALERRVFREQDKTLKKNLEEQLELEKKASAKSIKQARKAYDVKRHALGKKVVSSGAGVEVEKRSVQAKQAQEFIEGIKSHKTGAELAEGFKDAVSAMSGKDIFGLGKAGMRMSGSLLKGLAKGSLNKSARLSAKGAEMGGATGAALKGIGGAMKGIGPLLGGLGKALPMLGMVGGALFSLVKLLLDADAAIKEMNKAVLEGGASWDTYAAGGKNVEAGMYRMDSALRRVRDETIDLQMNSSMGTTAKDHQQVISTLEREGITLEQLTVGFKKYTDISKQSIVYSRLFGVSIDEVAQMQAEMMQQMGTGLDGLNKEFDAIGRAAEESGIAQNKFFAMLRGVSSDLALYGVRIGEATKMLGQLGKVMSPRTADKFLKTFAKGFQGKSIQDRLRATLFGGAKGIAVLKDSVKEQKADLIKEITDATGLGDADAAEILRGNKVKGQSLRGLEKEGKIKGAGAKQEAFQNLDLATRQLGKGIYGAAMALENVGGIGAYLHEKEQLKNMGGTGSFEKAMGGETGAERWMNTIAGGDEEVKALVGMERAIKQQKKDLIGSIDGTTEEQEALLNILKKYHKIDEKMSTKDLAGQKDLIAKQVESLSETQLWKSLDEKNAEVGKTQAEKDAEAMRKMGEEQGTRTQGIIDRLDLIFDALYNYIYGILMDLDDILSVKLFSPGTASAKRQALGSKSSDVMKAWTAGGGDVGKYMGAMSGSNTAKSIDALLHSKDDKDLIGKREQARTIARLFANGSLTGDLSKDMADALNATGIKGKAAENVMSGMKGVGKGDSMGVMKAISGGGLNENEMADLYSKMGIAFTDAISRRLLLEEAPGVVSLGEKYADLGKSTSVSGQQAEATKSKNPGTESTSIPVAPAIASTPVGGGLASPVAPPVTSVGGFFSEPPVAPPSAPAIASTPAGGGFFSPGSVTLPDEKKMSEAVLDQIDFTGDATVNSLQDLWKAIRIKGIKLDKPQLTGDIQNVIHKGTHLGAQDALFEYALYTSTDPADTLKKMKASGFEGLDTSAKSFEDQQAKRANENLPNLLNPVPANAEGGIVTGISGGFANVNPAPGEGFASIGRGERILPAGAGTGGGGGEVHLHVNGLGGADLANFLKGQIAQGIHEYKRREKFS